MTTQMTSNTQQDHSPEKKVRGSITLLFFKGETQVVPDVQFKGDIQSLDIQMCMAHIRRHYFGPYMLNKHKEEVDTLEVRLPLIEAARKKEKEKAEKEVLLCASKLEEDELKRANKLKEDGYKVEFDNINAERKRLNKPLLEWEEFEKDKESANIEKGDKR